MPEGERKFIKQGGEVIFETKMPDDPETSLKIKQARDGMLANAMCEKNAKEKIDEIQNMTDEEVLKKIEADKEIIRKLEGK